MSSRPFGLLPSGEPVEAFTLANAGGASAEILTYGGIVAALRVPDRRGQLADVVLGFNHLEPYVAGRAYLGALIGRIAGRLTGGRLAVEGRTYELARNNGANHLHGGRVGFDRRVWRATPLTRPDGAASLRLDYHSPDGEEGYPGRLDVAVIYTLTAANALVVETEAVSDRVTPLSLAQHSYFNLAGEGSGPVADHEVQICADAFVPAADAGLTLSGRREPVAGANDFRRPRRLGDALPGLFQSHGDCYLLDGPPPRLVARVVEPRSGRVLEVTTDESCLQFYTGVGLDGAQTGKSGRPYGPYAGFCLECQGYPDAASRPEFGDILVRPGRPQLHRTVYAFSAS